MSYILHVLNASGRLAPFAADIAAAVTRIEAAISQVAPLHPIDIIVADQPDMAIPEIGIGGYCGQKDLISLSLDPAQSANSFAPNGDFDRALVHETHHALRWRQVGYGNTLGEALVTEGLAGHFVHQVLGTPPEPWECAISGEQLTKAQQRAFIAWDDATYDHAAWFFGDGAEEQWCGYTLGYNIVGQYLVRHPQHTPASLADTPAAALRPKRANTEASQAPQHPLLRST